MYFTKYPHPANFTFARRLSPSGKLDLPNRELEVEVDSFEGDVYRIRVKGGWEPNIGLAPLLPPPAAKSDALSVTSAAGLTLNVSRRRKKVEILAGPAGEFFGVSGEASLFQLSIPPDTRFFGMGEKDFGKVELSKTRTRFWNTDVWSDFHSAQWREHPSDPAYFSTPYVVLRIRKEFVGLLLDNPYPTWIATPDVTDPKAVRHPSFKKEKETPKPACLVLGSEGGEPNLWIIYGPSLREVTRKLQKLVGVTPLPPLWSLGYQQSRWGYKGHDDLLAIDKKFEELGIPCDGLWMDLDYMRGYRVFDTSKEAFPKGAQATAKALAKNGRRIVPILDPGVKKDPGYRVYDDGIKQKVFCQNEEGEPFVGLVWPGETHFPDFTQERARAWWAGYVAGFREEGYGGTWIDMNDPSTGAVDPTGMRFRDGALPHEAFHNQYALGMHMATYSGFLKAGPDERPFILSRSGFTGSSRFGAIWTGDNVSNRFYLRNSIPATIGLSLSGMPFNGPDLGGFGSDAADALMIDWVKTDFLFPFFRNHSSLNTREQEPWQFKPATVNVIRHYIRLRYKLLPYLYNLFIDQEELGDPIMRPLFYRYDDAGLEAIDDQFMIGPSILQAPHVREESLRDVVLPGDQPWFDAASGHWCDPGLHRRARTTISSPLFLANGAIIPMRPGVPTDNRTDLLHVEFHVFVAPSSDGSTRYVYRADDGISFGYLRGERSVVEIEAKWKNGEVDLAWKQTSVGFGRTTPRFVFHGPSATSINGAKTRPKPARVRLTGSVLKANA